MNRYRKITALLCALILCLSCTCCFAESPDFYAVGLEVTGVLDQMVQSRDYLELFMSSGANWDLLETKFNTGDYDAPVAVYRLSQPDPMEWLKTIMPEEEMEKLAALSPVLQDQLMARMKGMSTLSSYVNAKGGVEILSLTSTLQAILDKPGLEPEETEYYLFLFEKGVPVVVTCGRNTASGMFLALDKSETESPEALQAALSPFGLEVSPVEIPEAAAAE